MTTIAATHKVGYKLSSDTTSYTTGTYTPTASGRLVVLTITHRQSAATAPTTTSVTGSSISGASLLTSLLFLSDKARTEIWLATSTGSAGTVTADYGASTQNSCVISIDELTGVDTAQGTSGFLTSNLDTDAAAVAGFTLTLSSFGDSENGAWFAVGHYMPQVGSFEGTWTTLYDDYITTDNQGLGVGFIASEDTSPSYSYSGAYWHGGIAIELAALVASTTKPPRVLVIY